MSVALLVLSLVAAFGPGRASDSCFCVYNDNYGEHEDRGLYSFFSFPFQWLDLGLRLGASG
jgi:hypothetical protein